jgi:hypothetical protein
MAVLVSWRTADHRWLVDRVIEKPGVDYRVWEETNGHELAAQLHGPIEVLRECLTRQGVDIGDLVEEGDAAECE